MHPTVPLDINGEVCQIDVGIVPVVTWLNALPGIRTEYSCQGDEKHQPYVMFFADDPWCLEPVTAALKRFYFSNGTYFDRPPELSVNYHHARVRFHLCFDDPDHLGRFIKFMGGVNWNVNSSGKFWFPQYATMEDQSVSDFTRSGTPGFAPSLAA